MSLRLMHIYRVALIHTVVFHYNMVQYDMILHTALQWLRQTWTQNLKSLTHTQKTLHSSPLWASYGVSFVMILENIESVITALHCMFYIMLATFVIGKSSWWPGNCSYQGFGNIHDDKEKDQSLICFLAITSALCWFNPLRPGPRLNIKTVLSTYGDFHVKDKTAVRTSYL